MKEILFPAFAAGAGVCIALQASANNNFRKNLDGPDSSLWAAFFSICGTILTASFVMLLLRPVAPSWESIQSTRWWNWIGGPLGALIVLAGASLVEYLDAAVFIALVVGGQLLASMLLEHYGLMGLKAVPISGPRVIGAVLVVAGVVCIKFM